ncbi:MAG: DUF389 domain-containing protein [Bacteroidales bacterium]|nr:DUF389 domain-containing protein [Bacteroidales bacterium]
MILETLKNQVKGYFNLTPYLDDQGVAKKDIIDGVSFRGPNIIILILAIFVASLGLNTNSTAVIIGAMLISPLMGPIVGIGLGVGTYDFPLIRRSARNLAAAALFSIMTATVYFLISPVSENHSELLARTSPTIYDVFIAFFGGAAGIVAIACKQKGNVIPGVAIATALMPPLCTVGYGIATWQLNYASGAFYLFVINSIFIALSTLIGVKLFKFAPVSFVDMQRRKRVKNWITAIVIATLLPSIYLTVMMLRDTFFINDANHFVQTEFNLPNTQVFSSKAYVQKWKKHIDVTLIGQAVNIDSLQLALTTKLNESRGLHGTILKITQGFSTNSGVTASSESTGLTDLFSGVVNQIESQKTTIDSLRTVINDREAFDSLSYVIAPELKVIFPQLTYIALGHNYVCDIDTRQVDTLNVALIEHQQPVPDLKKMKEYLETRTGLKNIHIIRTDIPIK